jgi:hypothetical protein
LALALKNTRISTLEGTRGSPCCWLPSIASLRCLQAQPASFIIPVWLIVREREQTRDRVQQAIGACTYAFMIKYLSQQAATLSRRISNTSVYYNISRTVANVRYQLALCKQIILVAVSVYDRRGLMHVKTKHDKVVLAAKTQEDETRDAICRIR